MSAVIDALLAIPPVRFVMGLVDARWRPLWALLWLAAIGYVISRTMHQLALRRARLRQPPVREPIVHDQSTPVPAPTSRARTTAVVSIPVPVLAGAVAAGALAVAGVAVATRPAPNDTPLAASSIAPDSVVRPEGPIDVRWRSGRMAGDDCIGTFEVTRGSGTRARLAAFVMDTSGAVMARDSAQVAAAVSGMFVDFRFRHVDCDEIDDWQLQATTPKPRERSP